MTTESIKALAPITHNGERHMPGGEPFEVSKKDAKRLCDQLKPPRAKRNKNNTVADEGKGKTQKAESKEQSGGTNGVVTVTPEPLNINKATLTALQKIDGIGKVTAKAIVDGRPWAAVADLEQLDTVSADEVSAWADLLIV